MGSRHTRLLVLSAALSFSGCYGNINPSSIMLPNLGPQSNYEIISPPTDRSVSRSLQYYTITFSATGLFVLLCAVVLTSAEYYKAKKQSKAKIIPNLDETKENEVDEDGVEERLRKDAHYRLLLGRQSVARVDCGSQCEDPAHVEAEVLAWKKKLRVRRRKLVNQPSPSNNSSEVDDDELDNRCASGTYSLPNLSLTNPYRLPSTQSVYSTPIKNTRLEVISYPEIRKLPSMPGLFGTPHSQTTPQSIFISSAVDLRAGSTDAVLLLEGTKVEGEYRGKGNWFPGTVTRAYEGETLLGSRSSAMYDLLYDDGMEERGVEAWYVRLREATVKGDKVTAAAGGGKSDPGPSASAADHQHEQGQGSASALAPAGQKFIGPKSRAPAPTSVAAAASVECTEGRDRDQLKGEKGSSTIDAAAAATGDRASREVTEKRSAGDIKGIAAVAVQKALVFSRHSDTISKGVTELEGVGVVVPVSMLFDVSDKVLDTTRAISQDLAKRAKKPPSTSAPFPQKVVPGTADVVSPAQVKADSDSQTGKAQAQVVSVAEKQSSSAAWVTKDTFAFPSKVKEMEEEKGKEKGKEIASEQAALSHRTHNGSTAIVHDEPSRQQAGAAHTAKEPTPREVVVVQSSQHAALDGLQEGSVVEGNYAEGGEWFRGKITKTRVDGSFDILYDDGDVEQSVRPALVRRAS